MHKSHVSVFATLLMVFFLLWTHDGQAHLRCSEVFASIKSVDHKILATVRPDMYLPQLEQSPFFKSLPPAIRNAIAREPLPFQYDSDIAAVGGDSAKAFVIAGINSNKLIADMPTLTGAPLNELTLRSSAFPAGSFNYNQPSFQGPFNHSVGMRASMDGWLPQGMSMRKLLLADNTLVRGLGFSHQNVAKPLLEIIKNIERLEIESGETVEVKIGRETFSVHVKLMPGGGNAFQTTIPSASWRSSDLPTTQGSLFNDNLFSNWAYSIQNSRGQILNGDALTPQLIYRYGFYQGGPHRMNPQVIIDFFDLKPDLTVTTLENTKFTPVERILKWCLGFCRNGAH